MTETKPRKCRKHSVPEFGCLDCIKFYVPPEPQPIEDGLNNEK